MQSMRQVINNLLKNFNINFKVLKGVGYRPFHSSSWDSHPYIFNVGKKNLNMENDLAERLGKRKFTLLTRFSP